MMSPKGKAQILLSQFLQFLGGIIEKMCVFILVLPSQTSHVPNMNLKVIKYTLEILTIRIPATGPHNAYELAWPHTGTCPVLPSMQKFQKALGLLELPIGSASIPCQGQSAPLAGTKGAGGITFFCPLGNSEHC